ncbi:MAG: hypothetical protein R3Y51_00735 [Rikenellaceae bacterium]
MKKLLYTLVAALVMVSCAGNTNSSKQNSSENTSEQTTKATEIQSYKLADLLQVAETLVDKDVTVQGVITHTCKHSGRRCFMVTEDQQTSFRIEAKGEIGGFNRELIGSELAVTGTLRESRLTNEYLNAWEEKIKESEGAEDGSAESCSAETNNINEMRKWMKDNDKDYYSLYFMDGTSFKVVE